MTAPRHPDPLPAELVDRTPTDDDIAALQRLSARLTTAAGALAEVTYRVVDSPVGSLIIAATEAGVVRLGFAIEDHDQVLTDLAGSIGPRILADAGRLDPAARELDAYFAGRLDRFTVPVDPRLSGGFRAEVLAQLITIGYGRTASYATVAQAVGRPRAVRAVGTACARNPIPIIVPCHRVVRSDGTTGQYRGGPEAKRWLLGHESAARG